MSLEEIFFKKIGKLIVSGRPLFDNITALPLEAASREDLPNGSSQDDGTTVIEDFL